MSADDATARIFFALMHVTLFKGVLLLHPEVSVEAQFVVLAGVALMVRDYARTPW